MLFKIRESNPWLSPQQLEIMEYVCSASLEPYLAPSPLLDSPATEEERAVVPEGGLVLNRAWQDLARRLMRVRRSGLVDDMGLPLKDVSWPPPPGLGGTTTGRSHSLRRLEGRGLLQRHGGGRGSVQPRTVSVSLTDKGREFCAEMRRASGRAVPTIPFKFAAFEGEVVDQLVRAQRDDAVHREAERRRDSRERGAAKSDDREESGE